MEQIIEGDIVITKNDRILVTGATGFLGQSLCAILKEEKYENVIKLGHGHDYFYFVDLLSFTDAVATFHYWRPKCVIHLASLVGGIGANKNRGGEFTYQNLQMGLNVVEAARLCGVEKVVMIGTVCGYPDIPPHIPFQEKDLFLGMPQETNSGYGIAKRALIKLCSEYNKQYGMKNISVIPTNLIGPGERFHVENSHVLPSIIQKIDNALTKKTVTLWGSGNCSREFLYVKDCAQAIVKCIQCDTHEGPINLGSGHEIKIKDLADMVANYMNYSGKIIFDTSKPDGQQRRCLDITLAKKILQWEPETSLEFGVTQTIKYYYEKIKI